MTNVYYILYGTVKMKMKYIHEKEVLNPINDYNTYSRNRKEIASNVMYMPNQKDREKP